MRHFDIIFLQSSHQPEQRQTLRNRFRIGLNRNAHTGPPLITDEISFLCRSFYHYRFDFATIDDDDHDGLSSLHLYASLISVSNASI